jgi:hypothetical protein
MMKPTRAGGAARDTRSGVPVVLAKALEPIAIQPTCFMLSMFDREPPNDDLPECVGAIAASGI